MRKAILKYIFIFAGLTVTAGFPAFARAAKDDPVTAAMYNQMGVEAVKAEAIEAAISYLAEAHRLDPDNKIIKKNLSAAYYQQAEIEFTKRDLALAQQYLESALLLDAENINAMVLLGEVKYLLQRLDEAKALWEKVVAVAPSYQYIGSVREKLEKLNKELKVEKDYRSTGLDQFDIKYSKEGAVLSYNVRYYLQEAYRLLGQDFDCRPRHKIIVLISDREEFETIGGWPDSVQGIYDGKIRLPLIGAELKPDEIRGLVWHEYTHLIVHEISKGKAPLWLNEGLAYYEGYVYANKNTRALKAAVENDKLVPFAQLDVVLNVKAHDANYWVACQEAYTLANYFMKRYNKYKIREILQLLGEGETFEAIAKRKLNITIKELEKRWLEELKKGKLY